MKEMLKIIWAILLVFLQEYWVPILFFILTIGYIIWFLMGKSVWTL